MWVSKALWVGRVLCGRDALVLGLGLTAFAATWAQDAEPEAWSVHAQSTFVRQQSVAFSAPYAGPKSLVSTGERSHSFSATAYLGARLWQGAEFYVNPEAVQSVPLSGALGLGALTSGEAQKSSGPELKGYIARAFWRQTWGWGGESQEQEAGANQLAGRVDANRVVLTVGALAVTDVFDRSLGVVRVNASCPV